jgi:uncharacterized membrane protein YgcG
MSLHLIKRIKDRLKLANELRQRGYEVPHPDSNAYDTTVATVLMDQVLYESLSDHFEPALGDVGASDQFSAPAGPDFSGGGGMSGGGGADGAW